VGQLRRDDAPTHFVPPPQIYPADAISEGADIWLRQRQANGLGQPAGEAAKITATLGHRSGVRANRTVGRLQMEDGFTRFHRQRHEAPVMLELGQTMRVIVQGQAGSRIVQFHRRAILLGNSFRPTQVGFYRPALAGYVL